MSDSVVKWLLEEENPSIRYYTLTSLNGIPPADARAIKAKEAIMSTGLVPKILAMQNGDGSWEDPARFYTDKYTGTSWTLLILAELGASAADSRIRKACEFILDHSQDPEGGGFSYIQSAKTGAGLPSGVIPCLTGNMTYSLIKLGYLDDIRVQGAIEWIIKYQRADDGTDQAPVGKAYERYEMCWGRHSCHMGVAKALKALSAIPVEKRNEDVVRKIDELAEYFLKHHIYKKSHNLDEVARPGWFRLGFPLMYQTDILELSAILVDLGIQDARMNDALEIIRAKRQDDGRWKLENSNNGKMLVDMEKKGTASKWITLRAIKTLKEDA